MNRPFITLSMRLLALILFTTGSFASAAPVCQSAASDSDNDGWGWENNQSCVVATDSTGDSGICRDTSSDPDGDGWGWENNRSCRVASNDSPDNPVEDQQTPNCASAASDHDNDGWGWENGASCQVVSSSPAPDTLICSDHIVDDNGDGWGWENNRSCRVETSPPAGPIRLMAVGDSITHGHRSANSYREPLEQLLEQNGCRFEYVGSQQMNYLHDGYVAPHEAYSGHTADDFLNGKNNAAGDNRGIDDSMSNYLPDVVLLHIGSNDMNRGHSIDGTVAEIDQIISIIHQHNSSAVVLLANVVPWYGTPQQSVQTLGTRLNTYVNQLSDTRVRLVDVRSGYSQSMMISDGIHPNATGDAHIADAFFDVYDRAGLCQ